LRTDHQVMADGLIKHDRVTRIIDDRSETYDIVAHHMRERSKTGFFMATLSSETPNRVGGFLGSSHGRTMRHYDLMLKSRILDTCIRTFHD
jgi:hypothetical protein